MGRKRCGHCKKQLALEHFHRNRVKPDGRAAICKPCQRSYLKAHYEKNKKYYKQKARARNILHGAVLREAIDEERRKHTTCQDCGHDWPVEALDFDHVRGTKRFTIAYAPGRIICSLEALKEEMKKCEVVCASCHRIRTARRRKEKNLPR